MRQSKKNKANRLRATMFAIAKLAITLSGRIEKSLIYCYRNIGKINNSQIYGAPIIFSPTKQKPNIDK